VWPVLRLLPWHGRRTPTWRGTRRVRVTATGIVRPSSCWFVVLCLLFYLALHIWFMFLLCLYYGPNTRHYLWWRNFLTSPAENTICPSTIASSPRNRVLLRFIRLIYIYIWLTSIKISALAIWQMAKTSRLPVTVRRTCILMPMSPRRQ